MNLKINKKDIKNFFVKKVNSNNITTKRILGITSRYSKGRFYKSFIKTLKYLEPYINVSIEKILEDFKKKSQKGKIDADIYLQDQEIMQQLVYSVDASKIKPAKGRLREIQLKELNFAKEIMADLEQAKIYPFMDDGSLLGAVRHGGFIPWDDDMDFSLMRKDYEKMIEYCKSKYIFIDASDWTNKTRFEKLEECFKKYPNQVFCHRTMTSFKLYKGTSFTDKVALDIFALDYYNDCYDVFSLIDYAKNFKKFVRQYKVYGERWKVFDAEIAKNENVVEDSNVIQAGIDNHDFYYYPMYGLRRKDDIFPLKKMQFEDTEFWAPNNPHEYLKTIYKFYDKLPLVIKNKHFDFDLTGEE